MKHYKKQDNTIWAFEEDGSQDHLITADMTPLAKEEVAPLLASILATTQSASQSATPTVPSSVSMKQARLALLEAGFLQTVKDSIAQMSEADQINWEFSVSVKRTDPLTASLATLLGLDEAGVDALFLAASKL